MPVPNGLERCPACGEYRGECVSDDPLDEGARLPVSCLCDGIVCPRCSVERMYRPISNRFDEAQDKVLHVPHFMGWFGCRSCCQAGADRKRPRV